MKRFTGQESCLSSAQVAEQVDVVIARACPRMASISTSKPATAKPLPAK
jgi:hypothetical protein